MANKKRGGVDIKFNGKKYSVHPEFELVEAIETQVKFGSKKYPSLYDVYFSMVDGNPPITLVANVLNITLNYIEAGYSEKEVKEIVFSSLQDHGGAWTDILSAFSLIAGCLLHGGVVPPSGDEADEPTDEEKKT